MRRINEIAIEPEMKPDNVENLFKLLIKLVFTRDQRRRHTHLWTLGKMFVISCLPQTVGNNLEMSLEIDRWESQPWVSQEGKNTEGFARDESKLYMWDPTKKESLCASNMHDWISGKIDLLLLLRLQHKESLWGININLWCFLWRFLSLLPSLS